MRSLAKFFALLLLLLFLASLLFFRNGIYSFFSGFGNRFDFGEISAGDISGEYQKLLKENQRLSSLLEESQIKTDVSGTLRAARVYSLYPFSDRSVLIIDQGADGGIGEGMPVLGEDGVLIGQVVKVKKAFSEVRTIFDPVWRSSVGIGSQKNKALLVGGSTPVLELIEPVAIVNNGDVVINLSPDFPYGLVIGELANLEKPLVQPWFQGELEPFFEFAALKEVWVETGFLD